MPRTNSCSKRQAYLLQNQQRQYETSVRLGGSINNPGHLCQTPNSTPILPRPGLSYFAIDPTRVTSAKRHTCMQEYTSHNRLAPIPDSESAMHHPYTHQHTSNPDFQHQDSCIHQHSSGQGIQHQAPSAYLQRLYPRSGGLFYS